MRSLLLFVGRALLLAAVVTPAALAQQDQLVALRDEKLASSFLKKAAWLTDFDQARAQAQKEGKILFTYFTRSYAP